MTTATAIDHRPYESLFIVPPETAQDKIDALIAKVKTTLSKEEGNLKGVQVWGRRRMAYPIGKRKEGLYVYVDFDGGIRSATALDGLFRVTDFVIRFLTVVKEEAPPEKKKSAPAAAPKDAKISPESPSPTNQGG